LVYGYPDALTKPDPRNDLVPALEAAISGTVVVPIFRLPTSFCARRQR
jgi:hypothetical protein